MRLRKSAKYVASLCLLLAGAICAEAQSGPVRYTVSLETSSSHLLDISMHFDSAGAESIDVAMPAWSPGAYWITDAWRNVQEFSASNESGDALQFEKTDKQTWRVYPKGNFHIVVHYKLFYRDYDYEDCYIRGPQVFMYVRGNRPYPLGGPVSVKLEGVPKGWMIETGMEQGNDPFSFQAPDYDTFVDASIVAGSNLSVTRFDYEGVPYYLVFIGEGNFDKAKIAADVKTVTSYLVDMMGGAPYKKYIFFLRAAARPGGVEHLNSTDMSISAYDTMSPRANYSRFLFVAAHEFFHLWNVKRIRPAILGPFDYSREQNTRDLYVSEGMTSYWATIGLRRSGLWSRQEYYDEFIAQLSQLESSPGRKIMSVEQSSWDTWNRSDNSANNSIDYYNKGELLGNLLDLEIRYRTKNRKSLTDVFLYLLKTNGLPKPGFEERRGFRDAVELITREVAPDDADFGEFFRKYVAGTDEIPWNQFLEHAGLELEQKQGALQNYIGITTGTGFRSNFHGAPPTFTPLPGGQLGVVHIDPGSAAEKAGLDTGDILVALDGERVRAETFDKMFAEKKPGSTVDFSVLRGERLLNFTIVVGQRSKTEYSIKEKTDPTPLQRSILASWLGTGKQ